MPNPFVHVELNTHDVAAAKKFYRGLFDWKLADMEMGPGETYTMVDVGKGTGGGMQKNSSPGTPPQWLSYVEVDDVVKTMAKAKKLGATVIVDYQPVEGMGALGIFVDPTGAALGVWQAVRAAPKKAAKKPAAKKKRK